MDDGVPGAAKNTGGGALASLSLPCKGRVASHKRVYARLRRAMARRVGFVLDITATSPHPPLASARGTLPTKRGGIRKKARN